MDCQKVRGLDCEACTIASCTTSVMRTPVSKLDAEVKKADMDKLEWDCDVGMYFIKRNLDSKCSFFSSTEKKCVLPLERRFNSCLVYPVRVYMSVVDVVEQIILNTQCPSAVSLFDMYARKEPSAVNYIKGAVKIFLWDHDYRKYVLNKTKDFHDILRVGSISWIK